MAQYLYGFSCSDTFVYSFFLISLVSSSFLSDIPYWPHWLMFSTLLATMHFHFVLHFALNCSTILSSHCCLLSGHFWSLGYTTWQLHRSTCLWILGCVWPSRISAFSTLWSCPSLTLNVLTQWYSQHGSFYIPLCCNQLLFFLLASLFFTDVFHHRQNSAIKEIDM